MTLDELLPQLIGVRRRGARWSAHCPAHADKSPSLSVSEGDKGLLLRCFAGCSLEGICHSLGIEQRELFYDNQPDTRRPRPNPRPVTIDRVALAFRYELAALDRRLRAERVLQATHPIAISGLQDQDLDRLVDAVGQAYADIDRAKLFEGVADGLREKAFTQKEGNVNHAA